MPGRGAVILNCNETGFVAWCRASETSNYETATKTERTEGVVWVFYYKGEMRRV